jgi:hypothetical protein
MRAIAACVLLLASCVPCPKVSQLVTITSADETLMPLFEACRSGQTSGAIYCAAAADAAASQIACPCWPLCQRVLEIVDQFQGSEKLESCNVFSLPDGGSEGGIVGITYRPSTCP